MTEEQAKKLIRLLEVVKTRPAIYIMRADDYKAVQVFLVGVNTTCRSLVKLDDEPFMEVITRRGWKSSPEGLVPSMREAGLSDEAIVQEFLDIDIEAYKRIFNLT